MNKQQKRKNQKKYRDNMSKAFMEGFEAMQPKTILKKQLYDVFSGKKLK